MLSLVGSLPGARMSVRIFSGLEPGGVKRALLLTVAEDGVEPAPEVVRGVVGGGGGGGDGGSSSNISSGSGSGAPRAGLGTVIVAAATAAAEAGGS